MKTFKEFKNDVSEGSDVEHTQNRFGEPKKAFARDEEGTEEYSANGEVISVEKKSKKRVDDPEESSEMGDNT